jgi:GNAT superfamily N-acetyltransferase
MPRDEDGVVEIADADATCCAEILAVVRAAFAAYEGKLVPESGALSETVETLRGRLASSERAAVALRAGRIVGAAFYRPERGEVYIGRLAVLPEFRGRGIAGRLIARIEAFARRGGVPALSLRVRIALPDNVRLFTRLGFREVSREAHPGFAKPTSIRMEKRLG